jgi:hydrogenase expression/formation protein HypC
MCVAAEGTVLSVKGRDAVVDFHGNEVMAKCGLVQVKPGDHVLVHAGCILQVLSQREQNEMTDLSAIFAEVGAY